MRLKLVSALAAFALVSAVPSVASAQEDKHSSQTQTIVGISFALTAILILILADSNNHNHNNGGNLPVSP